MLTRHPGLIVSMSYVSIPALADLPSPSRQSLETHVRYRDRDCAAHGNYLCGELWISGEDV